MIENGVVRNKRAIRNIKSATGAKLPDITLSVVVEEQHRHTAEISDHPVQRGAPVSDHMFVLPYELRCTYCWSASTVQGDTVAPSAPVDSPRTILDKLVALQEQAALFEVQTGKRLYKDMVLAEISTTTDATTENSLWAQLTFRRVLLADVTTVRLDASSLRDAAANASIVQTGTINPVKVGE